MACHCGTTRRKYTTILSEYEQAVNHCKQCGHPFVVSRYVGQDVDEIKWKKVCKNRLDYFEKHNMYCYDIEWMDTNIKIQHESTITGNTKEKAIKNLQTQENNTNIEIISISKKMINNCAM